MKKIILISITLLIFVIGVSCASAASVDASTGSHLKTKDSQSLKISKKVAVKKIAQKKTAKKAVKKLSVKKSKKSSKKTAVKKSKKTAKKSTALKSSKKINKVINGWNPKDHEVSRKNIGNGLIRINYDDGYHRIVNKAGDILSFGF